MDAIKGASALRGFRVPTVWTTLECQCSNLSTRTTSKGQVKPEFCGGIAAMAKCFHSDRAAELG
jgi:hypothetical protein